MKDIYIDSLNDRDKNTRLSSLKKLMLLYETGALEAPITGVYVNNHMHTTYSFSSYSPTMALFKSWQSGLAVAGIMDHDSVAGANEFLQAADILNIPATIGFELRCSLNDTPFEGKRLNNPDQNSVAYFSMHGVPHQMLAKVDSFLAPYREKRNIRNWKMVDRLNDVLRPYSFDLDFTSDVLPLSEYSSGGSITERHILYALAAKISPEIMPRHFLLGLFKSQLVERFYVDAVDELPHISEFIALSRELGAIPTYNYLGDDGISVISDKKNQTYEDDFLDDLLHYLKDAGIRAISYVPTRNTNQQLTRIIEICKKYEFFQISGEDVNSPLQKFICPKLDTPEFEHLIESAWALVGHERASNLNLNEGLFSQQTIKTMPNLTDRVVHFAELGRDKYRKKRKV